MYSHDQADEHSGDTRTTYQMAEQLGRLLRSGSLTITTAESCTGGLIAGALTEVAGSSAWFERSVVTYSNAAKHALLGVDESVFSEHGAVSKACVTAMALGALHRADAQVAISVSGIAGPDGGTPDKPVGTVWIGWAIANFLQPAAASDLAAGAAIPAAPAVITAQSYVFPGDRQNVREQAVQQALRGTISRLANAGLHKR